MGLRVGEHGEDDWDGNNCKMEKREDWKRKEQQRYLLCIQTPQTTRPDEGKESSEKVRFRGRNKDGCESERGWKREDMSRKRGENQWRRGMEVVIA